MSDRGCEECARRSASTSTASSRVWRPRGGDDVELLFADYRQQVFPPHSHRRYAIGIVEAGVEEVIYAGERYLFGPGDVAVFAPGVVHSVRVHGSRPVRLRVMFVEPSHLDEAGATLDITRPVLADPEFATRFRHLHRDLDTSSGRPTTELLESLASFGQRHGGPRESPSGGNRTAAAPPSLERCLRLARRRIEEGVRVDELARESGLSRFQLIRRFREVFQMTPQGYLTQLRVRRAKELLREGQPIVEVALAAGFADQSHLTRVFRRWVGVTPASFR